MRRSREFRARFENAIDQCAVVCSDVLHIACVFVATFDFETTNAGVNERCKVGALVVVLHRQQMLVERDDAALSVFERVRQSTFLRA